MKIDHSAVSSWINMTEKRKICDSVIIRKLKVLPGLYNQKQPPEVFCKKKVFLEVSQNSQENTCTRVSFLMKLLKKRLLFLMTQNSPDFRVLWSKFVKFLMSILNWQVNSFSNFTSFFNVMTHNSPLSFKLIHFLLWIKGSHQGPNF